MMMLIEFLRQLALAFLGTVCFGLLFHVPPRHFAALWHCGRHRLAGLLGHDAGAAQRGAGQVWWR